MDVYFPEKSNLATKQAKSETIDLVDLVDNYDEIPLMMRKLHAHEASPTKFKGTHVRSYIL
jgi:hypothetical protein